MDQTPRGSTPVPDPTELTDKAIAKLKEQLEQFIQGKITNLETRLDGMDTATDLNKAATDKIPCLISEKVKASHDFLTEKISGLKELTLSLVQGINTLKEEKFKELHERLTMVEKHRVEAKQDDASALTAALSAAKEAVSEQNKSNALAITKSETSTMKTLDGINATILTATRALDDKINDLKGRLDRGEGQKTQQVETKGQQNWFISLFVIGGLSLVSIIIGIMALLNH